MNTRHELRHDDVPPPAHQGALPASDSPYWRFYDAVAAEQLAAWQGAGPGRVLDLSPSGDLPARQLADAGHEVLQVGPVPVAGVRSVHADRWDLAWLRDDAVDAVLVESSGLSQCLVAEVVVQELARVLRPGGRLLLVVDALALGLALLARQSRWAELADSPSADVLLVPVGDGRVTRCFGADELRLLLGDAGFDVDWVRPRSALPVAAVLRGFEQGGRGALATLLASERLLWLDPDREADGLHLVASARLP